MKKDGMRMVGEKRDGTKDGDQKWLEKFDLFISAQISC